MLQNTDPLSRGFINDLEEDTNRTEIKFVLNKNKKTLNKKLGEREDTLASESHNIFTH